MVTRQDMITEIAAQHWNVRDLYKNLSLEELQATCKADRLPYAVCAINITGDLNIGMMIRSACLLGAEKFFIFGTNKYDKRSTVGAQNYINVIKFDAKVGKHQLDLHYTNFDSLMHMHGYFPVFFDTGGIPLDQFSFIKPPFETKPCLVFGNEGMGLPLELIQGREVVTIPQLGVLRSLNVSAAASIAMYQAMRAFS